LGSIRDLRLRSILHRGWRGGIAIWTLKLYL
jgi:hypothetical protein